MAVSMIAPAITILRVNASATDAPRPAFLRLLTRTPLSHKGTLHLSELCSTRGVARAVLRSDFVDRLRVVSAEHIIDSLQQPEMGPRAVPVLTVCLVEDGAALQDDAAMLRDFVAGLEAVPWSPEVLVACISGRSEALASLATCLEAHFPGASIRYLDLCSDGQEPTSFWWWRHDMHRVAVLPSSGNEPSDGLEKILTAVREAGIEMAGDSFLILAPETLLADGYELSRIGLLILDLQDNWAFAGGPPLSDRQKEQHGAQRTAFIGLMETAIGMLRCEVRLTLSRNRSLKQLHPELLDAISPSPEMLPDTAFVPLGQQLRTMSAEMRRGLSVLDLPRDAAPGGNIDALEAEHTALIGLREVVGHRIAVQEARGGGDLSTRLDMLFEASSRELQRLIDHGIELISREVRAGAYPGIDGKDAGLGCRKCDRWYKHCRLRDHARTNWTRGGHPGDDGPNWVIATPEPSDPFSMFFNPRRTLESHPRVQALVAEAISRKCIDGIARLTLACDLFLETVVRGESRAILCELQPKDVNGDSEEPEGADPLPSGSHRATGLAGRRASELVSAERVRSAVPTWPRVEKVPAHLNLRQSLKSIGLLTRQAVKLGAALLMVVAISPIDFSSDPSSWLKRLSELLLVPLVWPLLLAGLILTVWLSLGAHLAQIAEKLDKLRDDTHRALEGAATTQLAVARKVISDIVTDDVAAIRNDLQAAIQSRDGSALKSLGANLREIESQIAVRKADIERMRTEKKQNDTETKTRRGQAATILKKFFSLKGLAE